MYAHLTPLLNFIPITKAVGFLLLQLKPSLHCRELERTSQWSSPSVQNKRRLQYNYDNVMKISIFQRVACVGHSQIWKVQHSCLWNI